MSDSGSSSLSELEEEETMGTTGDSMRDVDSEAETERLEPSPSKLRKHVNAEQDAALGDQDSVGPERESSLESSDGEDTDTNAADDANTNTNGDVEHDNHMNRRAQRNLMSPNKIPSSKDLAGQKRKRTISMTLEDTDPGNGPAKKRSSSSRTDNTKRAEFQRRSRTLRGPLLEDVVDEDALKSSDEDESGQPDGKDEANGLAPQLYETDRRGSSNEEADGSDPPTPEPDDVLGDDDQNVEGEPELESGSREDGEDEETDVTAKTDDELAKKQLAMDQLKPIENMFAILRDRIFDDRLATLSEELEMLNQPNPTHPDFLAMRQTLDARRDEKIQHEKVLLGYNLELAKNNAIGKHHQSHCQYAQMVRDTRERNLGHLNKLFCNIKHELREWEPKEPHFMYHFDPERPKQISYQTATNKEVSILSGLARYVGFPSAPEMQGASSVDIEKDFRDMMIKQPLQTRLSGITNPVQMERAAEEQFIESTPWANPRHPVVQQVLTRERQQSAQPFQAGPRVNSNSWLVDIQPETIPTTSTQLPSAASHTTPANHLQALQQERQVEASPQVHLGREGAEEVDTEANTDSNPLNTESSELIIGPINLRPGESFTKGLPPYDPTAVQQAYRTSALHSQAVSEILATAPVGVQGGSFGTPGPSLLQGDAPEHYARQEGAGFPFPTRESPLNGTARRISVDRVGGR